MPKSQAAPADKAVRHRLPNKPLLLPLIPEARPSLGLSKADAEAVAGPSAQRRSLSAMFCGCSERPTRWHLKIRRGRAK